MKYGAIIINAKKKRSIFGKLNTQDHTQLESQMTDVARGNDNSHHQVAGNVPNYMEQEN